MTYSPASPLLTTDPLRIDTQAFAAYANRLGGARAQETREYVEAVVSGALQMGIDPVLVLAQWALETGWSRSEPWVTGLNPAGLGMTKPGGYPANPTAQRWSNGTWAAYGHLAHLAAYIWGDDAIDYWPQSWPDPVTVDQRFAAPIRAGYEAHWLKDLNGTWAIDPQNNYHGKLADRANAIVRDFGRGHYTETETAVEPEGDDSMALTIRQGMIPAGRKNRPGWKLNNGGLWLTTHDTGNPNRGANAEMHRRFVDEGGGGTHSVSFHFTVDDKEAIQLLPLDEVGYHAGDGCNNRNTDRGCFASVATELCINSDGDWWGAYANLKDLYAAIITGDSRIDFGGRKGDFSETRLTTHNAVADDRKWCPGTILNKGLTADLTAGVVNRVKIIRDQEPPKPVYAKTYPVGTKSTTVINGHLFLAPGGKTVQRDQAPMQFADANTLPTGPVYPKGHKFSADQLGHVVQGTDGNIWVVLTNISPEIDGSRFPAMAFVAEGAGV